MWLNHRYREQARSHMELWVLTVFVHDTKELWERACSRWRQHSQHHHKLTLRLREQARSHRRNAFTLSQVGYKAASLWLLILGAPLNHAGRTQALRSGHPGMDAGLAALGHGWPFAAAHGAMPAFGHTEPRRGAEWWGKSVLLTFALLKSEPPSGRNRKWPLPKKRIYTQNYAHK